MATIKLKVNAVADLNPEAVDDLGGGFYEVEDDGSRYEVDDYRQTVSALLLDGKPINLTEIGSLEVELLLEVDYGHASGRFLGKEVLEEAAAEAVPGTITVGGIEFEVTNVEPSS